MIVIASQVSYFVRSLNFSQAKEKTNKLENIIMAYNVATLDELIAELHKAFESDSVDVDHVTQLMQSYKTNPADWGKFAKFDRYR